MKNDFRVILFYKFIPVADPLVTKLWQLELGRRLGLTGRLIIADHGLNGTLAGQLEDLKAYRKALNEIAGWRDIDYKWSATNSQTFPKLSVKVRSELVTLEPEKEFDVYNSSQGLSAQQWHDYLEKNPNTLVLDARNDYESQIGHFQSQNLIKPAIKSFKEIKPVIDQLPKDQPILTYCTGNVRCEYLSAYMRDKGFLTVHHLRGGIIKYGQKFFDQGLWRGKCYVFDGRQQISFSKQSVDIAQCSGCRQPASQQANCRNCNQQLVVCSDCQNNNYQHC